MGSSRPTTRPAPGRRPGRSIAWPPTPCSASRRQSRTARHAGSSDRQTSLGPPDHANRGNGAELLEQDSVHRELGEPDPLDQLVRQVASAAGLRVASVPEEIQGSIGGKLPPDDPQRLLRLKPERRDIEREDLVESLVPEVRILERGRL